MKLIFELKSKKDMTLKQKQKIIKIIYKYFKLSKLTKNTIFGLYHFQTINKKC